MTEQSLPERTVGLQGCYAGAVSRLSAFVLDLLLSLGILTLFLAAISYGLNILTSHSIKWKNHLVLTVILLAVWEVIYFAYPWSASGKSPGMAVLGVRVVRADGTPAGSRNAIVRILVLPISIVFLLIGCLWMLFQRERRAWHDLAAGTAVIYAWDARAAQLRFLARQAETSALVESEGPGPTAVIVSPTPLPPASTESSTPPPAPTVSEGAEEQRSA
jgi:uncharacterized RDD family membrane protein YckC